MRAVFSISCSLLRSWTVLPSGLWSSFRPTSARVSWRFPKFQCLA